jgi:hypothetical protein
MKSSIILLSLFAANQAFAAGQINVTVQNKCDKPTSYTIVSKGSKLDTSLSPRSSKSSKLEVGDKISVGSTVTHTVASGSEGKTVIICNK